MTPKQLRALRARTGWSQADFARLCYVTEGTISRWECLGGDSRGRKIHPLSAVGIIGCLNRAFGYRLEAKDYV